MKITDITRRAGRSLRQAKARTLLTSLAIAVGAFTLTLSLAAGQGSREYADKLIGSNVNPKMLFIVKDKSLFGEGGAQPGGGGLKEYDPDASFHGGVTIKQVTQADIDKLEKRGDLENIEPVYQPRMKNMQVAGSDKKFTAELAMYDATIKGEAAAGDLPPLGTQLQANDVVVPEAYADTLVQQKVIKNKNDLIGKKVTLAVEKPPVEPSEEEINEILATEGPQGLTNLGKAEAKEVTLTVRALARQSSTALAAGSAIQISNVKAKELAEYTTKGTDNYQKYMGVTALAAGDKTPETIKAELEESGFTAQTAKDLQNLLFTIVNILQGIVIGFGILALIASVFGIINTQYISVLERTQQIGLMKALGMRKSGVCLLFLFEAAWIGFLGGVIGAALAWVAGVALNPVITDALSLGEGNHLLVFQLWPVVVLIVSLMLVAMIAGLFPALKAAKLDPIEALRTE